VESRSRLEKETFLRIAEASGLDTKDPYIEELYAYVGKLFPGFKVAEGIDLTNVEPMVTFISSKE
jgi:Asp-tRNA(Asn)/Glu-tRNA(Gln) amidotransferase C subunit